MTLRRVFCAFALLCGVAVWAGGSTVNNPTTFRPHPVTTVVRPARLQSTAPHKVRSAAPVPAPRPVHILALRGVTVSGDWMDLDILAGLSLTDALPVPSEPLADLEIDLSNGETITVALEDPDAASEEGWVVIDGSEGDAVAIAVR